ncbi:MAG: hypothetical protein ACHQ50_02890 [Fimbriimonadales bacterium]
MLERARLKYYTKVLGVEAGASFIEFEDACEREQGGTPYAKSVLEWLQKMTPEDRLEGLRLARAKFENIRWKEGAVRLITHKNRLELMVRDCQERLDKSDLTPEQRSEIERTISQLEPQLKKQLMEFEELRRESKEMDARNRSSWAVYVERYGEP